MIEISKITRKINKPCICVICLNTLGYKRCSLGKQRLFYVCKVIIQNLYRFQKK